MGRAGEQDGSVALRTCGCGAPARRLCDVCDRAAAPFAACSLACLDRHLAEAHAGDEAARGDSATRAAAALKLLNRRFSDSRERYQEHRRQLMALALASAPQDRPARDIAVFGAGNGSDLDLPALAERFPKVHLYDLGEEALERARQSLPPSLREQVILHAPVDLSGFLGRLDEWGAAFPDGATLERAAADWARTLVGALQGGYDVVLSACVLSQLVAPFHRAWITTQANWDRLGWAITVVHLATLVGSLRPGGRAVLAVDVLSSRQAPDLATWIGRSADELDRLVKEEVAAGTMALNPPPQALMDELRPFGPILRDLRATPFWLWTLRDATLLVYALRFQRA